MTLESLLPPGVTPEDAIIVMSGLSAFASALAVWFALLQQDPAGRRAKMLSAQREAMRAGLIAPRRRNQRLQPLTIMRRVVERLHLMRSTQADKITRKLMRAGWRSKDAVIRYLFFKVASPIVVAGIALFLMYGVNAYDLEPLQKLLATLVAVLLGAYGPDLYVKNAGDKRQKKIKKGLPDALDLMVICAEAGLSLDATLKRVADEMARAAPELAEEFGITALELGFLPDRRRALHNMVERSDLPGIRAMVNTLMQSEKYGTPLAHSLRVLSAEFRDERILKAEEKAARLPAMLTVPMIVFILPPLFFVLIGPAALDVIDAMRGLGY
jgi:tight adherence protein C